MVTHISARATSTATQCQCSVTGSIKCGAWPPSLWITPWNSSSLSSAQSNVARRSCHTVHYLMNVKLGFVAMFEINVNLLCYRIIWFYFIFIYEFSFLSFYCVYVFYPCTRLFSVWTPVPQIEKLFFHLTYLLLFLCFLDYAMSNRKLLEHIKLLELTAFFCLFWNYAQHRRITVCHLQWLFKSK